MMSSSNHQKQPHHTMTKMPFLTKIFSFVGNKKTLTTPVTLKSVSSTWHEAVVYYKGARYSLVAYFARLNEEKTRQLIMKLLKASCDCIIKDPQDDWILDTIFFTFDHLHLPCIDVFPGDLFAVSVAARDSLWENRAFTESELKRWFSTFCELFGSGQALSTMIWDAFSKCVLAADAKAAPPFHWEIAKFIIEDYYCDDKIEDALLRPFSNIKMSVDWLSCAKLLYIWLEGLKKLNKLEAAKHLLLQSAAHRHIFCGPFLHYVTQHFVSADELQQGLSILMEEIGHAFLRQLFLQSACYSDEYNASFVLSYALCDHTMDCFTVLVDAASSLGGEFFVDLCLKVDGAKGLPLLSLACSLGQDKQAEIILTTIHNIGDSILLRKFFEAQQKRTLEQSTFFGKKLIHYAFEFFSYETVKALIDIVRIAGDKEYLKDVLSLCCYDRRTEKEVPPLFFACRNARKDSFQTIRYVGDVLREAFGVGFLREQINEIDQFDEGLTPFRLREEIAEVGSSHQVSSSFEQVD